MDKNGGCPGKRKPMKLRVAMLSRWHVHAEGYAEALRAMDDVEITCVWDEDEVSGRAWAEVLGVEFEADLKTLLERRDVDAVVVDTPTSAHVPVICAAAQAGKHIFTEKVLAATRAGAEEIQRAVEAAGVVFCISYPQRVTRQIRYIKEQIDQGSLGTVSLLRIRDAHGGKSQNWLPERWYDLSATCGGAMMDLGAHPNYLALYLLGRPSSVNASFASVETEPGYEDNAVSVFTYENGALAVLETGFLTPASPRSLEIHGTRASLWMSGEKIWRREAGAAEAVLVAEGEMPQALPMPLAQWVDGIRKGAPVSFGLKEALELTAVMEAAYRSSKERKVAAVPS